MNYKITLEYMIACKSYYQNLSLRELNFVAEYQLVFKDYRELKGFSSIERTRNLLEILKSEEMVSRITSSSGIEYLTLNNVFM